MERIFPNGWTQYLTGGVLVGVGTALIFVLTGIRAGASGFFTTALSYVSRRPGLRSAWSLSQRGWRTLFSLGLVAGAALYTAWIADGRFVTGVQAWRLVAGGLLVGLGTRLSRGCTSGHGICGLSAGARSSLLAVAVFMAVAMVTAWLVRMAGVAP
jgi:uncharacterized membrane protein YedE/YeeE